MATYQPLTTNNPDGKGAAGAGAGSSGRIDPTNPPPGTHIITCSNCKILLQYPHGAWSVNCPKCNTITSSKTMALVNCEACGQKLSFPYGARKVVCLCKHMNDLLKPVPLHISRPVVEVRRPGMQAGRSQAPAPAPSADSATPAHLAGADPSSDGMELAAVGKATTGGGAGGGAGSSPSLDDAVAAAEWDAVPTINPTVGTMKHQDKARAGGMK